MRVRKTTFEEDLTAKEKAFLVLTGEERLLLMRKIADRIRQPGQNYQLRGSRVRIIHRS